MAYYVYSDQDGDIRVADGRDRLPKKKFFTLSRKRKFEVLSMHFSREECVDESWRREVLRREAQVASSR